VIVVHFWESPNVWLGFLGGLAPSISTLITWAKTDRPQRPSIPLRDPAFWLLFFVLPTLGGAVVGLYEFFGTKFNGLLAFQVGITAPAFLQQLASSAPPLGKAN
jgi:hypothetical protein